LAVVGFDDTPESAYCCPPLTTVRQDLQALGCTAVRELVRTIEASQQGKAAVEPRNVLLQPELIIRQSSMVAKP
jgi:LacI family transcriptional regulator